MPSDTLNKTELLLLCGSFLMCGGALGFLIWTLA